MTIIGIVGAIGSGKSHAQLKYGLDYANKRKKQLVCNFLIDSQELYKYACLPSFIEKPYGGILIELVEVKAVFCSQLPNTIRAFLKVILFIFLGLFLISKQLIIAIIIIIILRIPNKKNIKPLLPWIKQLIERRAGIIQIPNPENLQALMIPEAVVLLDEAGILLNSREFAKTPKALLADLAQSRKFGTDLIWCAQFDDQIDRQMRMLTQYFWHCSGMSIWDLKMRRPKLFYKTIHIFNADNYTEWSKNPKARTNAIKTRFAYALNTYSGLLNKADLQVFNCFDSFARLDLKNERGQSRISTIYQCQLKSNKKANILTLKELRGQRVFLKLLIEYYKAILKQFDNSEVRKALGTTLKESVTDLEMIEKMDEVLFSNNGN